MVFVGFQDLGITVATGGHFEISGKGKVWGSREKSRDAAWIKESVRRGVEQ